MKKSDNSQERESASESEAIVPFLKWPGGKRWLANSLSVILRHELSGTYYEPFIGGGAVFLSLQPERAILCDANPALIDCLRTSSRKPETVLRALWRWTNTAECYYQVRNLNPRKETTKAAKFIYLSRTCWGGIYRVNRQGKFNVPFGNSGRTICHAKEFILAAKVFKNAELLSSDFEFVIEQAGEGDVVYADPPYTTLGQNNGFARYNEHLFAWKDQERLAVCCRRAKKRGAFVAISGLWHETVLSLYSGWWAIRSERMSTVSRVADGRRMISEAVIFSRKPLSENDQVVRL